MDYKLIISKIDFEETINNRIELGRILFDKLKEVKNENDLNDAKLEYELWDDYNINIFKASFNKEIDKELYKYNDGIAIIQLKSALSEFRSNPKLKQIEILSILQKQLDNLRILKNRIDFYDEVSSTEKKESLEKIELFSSDILQNTRGYIENTGKQIILCYKYDLYDACLVMIRRLLETLIIECFEKFKIQSKIQDSSGKYLRLSDLIGILLKEKTWTINPKIKHVFSKIKLLADMSAHSRRFIAKKADIDQFKIELRIIIEELVHIIDY